ncbi:golgin IMH1-like [Pyrus ussuriensis x Pyrus communis]|uniref:Golgin IMH1-like n=1 Tax=Pyrus ussuriensis x Pyrus communis TaxID=2448454 RepID=A0A5N5F8F0_9ROSA|nr:golgin IMH1-like [Pyrus ussuriensis x Pyrus communis]
MIVREGNNKVRKSKMQRLISQFEKLEMGEEEPYKTTINEARDIDTLSFADLSGALQTYESELPLVKKANKNLALKVIKEEDDDCNEIDPKQLALITRHFQKLLKKQNSKGSGSGTRSSINKTSKDGSQRFIPKSEGRKYYACSRYGHEDKDDNESNMSEVEEEKIAFVALENNDESDDSDEEDVDIEETREKYKELYLNFDKVKKQNDALKIKVQKNEDEWQRTETSLRSQVNNLLAKRYLLKQQLKEAKEKLHRLFTRDEKLDRMIEMGKPNVDKTNIGFKPFSSTNYVTKFC